MSEILNNQLNEEDLQGVSGGLKASAGGGGTNSQDKGNATEKHFCTKCNKDQVFIVYSGARSVCSVCKTPYTF